MELGLHNLTAVVLGGTSGIGEAIARALAAEGANVAVVGRRVERAEQVAAELGSAVAIGVDITNADAAERIVEAATQAFGRIDIVILNGGGPAPSFARDFTAEDAQAAFDLLVKPHVSLVNRVLPEMIERNWGRIIAVGSAGVQEPIANLTASNVGRAGLAGFLKTLAGQVAPHGVTVNMVLPGLIATDRTASLDQAAAQRLGISVAQAHAQRAQAIPAGRYGDPAEFASVVAFVASTKASYVTGEQIRCDGGLIRHH